MNWIITIVAGLFEGAFAACLGKTKLETIENNVNRVDEELKDSKINLIRPEGTYQLWLDFREVFKDTKEMFTIITEGSGLGLNGGHWFGREGALFMRMNIATSTDKVLDSMNKIKKLCPMAIKYRV